MGTFFDNIFDKEIYLIRHPKTVVGHSICYGASDIPVATEVMEATAQEISEKLEGFNPDYCYSSPLIRCRTLAERLFEDKKIILKDEIREVSFGNWEGMPWGEIPVEAQKRWGEDVLNFKEHQGENFSDLQNRVIPFWKELMADDTIKSAVVAHAGVIVALLSHLLQADPAKVFMLDITFGSIVRIRVKGNAFFKIKML